MALKMLHAFEKNGGSMTFFLSILMFVISLGASAQEVYQYQLKGSYKLQSTDKKPVQYTLRWKENKDKIEGEYSDDFFIDSIAVKALEGNPGRNFVVELPSIKNGVKSLTLLTSEVTSDRAGTSIPVSIITRDRRGNPLTTSKANSNFSTLNMVAQKQEDTSCQDGFGALANYCGTYEGLVSEFQDKRNKCNLLFASVVRLELTQDQTLILHLGETNELVNIPYHVIGRLPSNPQSTAVDVMSRSCRPLQGVNVPGDSCKQSNLTGTFSIEGNRRHFSGAYSIKEEGTNNFCQYTLSMDIENQL